MDYGKKKIFVFGEKGVRGIISQVQKKGGCARRRGGEDDTKAVEGGEGKGAF